MKLRFVATLAILLMALGLSAQVGSTAPVTDFETQLVCWDDSGTPTTIVRVALYQVGETTPLFVRYEDLDGTAVTVGADPITFGPCAGDASTAAENIDYQILDLCDDGTPFYRFIRIDESDNSTTDLGDFDTDFASYTVSGTVSAGPCATSANATVVRTVSVTTAGSIAAGKQSCSVCNTGVNQAAFTVDAGPAATLHPGECWRYVAYLNPVTRVFQLSPAVSWDNASTIVATYAD